MSQQVLPRWILPLQRINRSVWPVHQLFNTLVETDDSLHIVPSLAKRWNISEDRLRFTFYLRNDVFFHDDDVFANGKGRRMTAKMWSIVCTGLSTNKRQVPVHGSSIEGRYIATIQSY